MVQYETANEAENALLEAGSYNGDGFSVEYAPKELPKPKLLDEVMDPDVQYELEAMATATAKRQTYPSMPRVACKKNTIWTIHFDR